MMTLRMICSYEIVAFILIAATIISLCRLGLIIVVLLAILYGRKNIDDWCFKNCMDLHGDAFRICVEFAT